MAITTQIAIAPVSTPATELSGGEGGGATVTRPAALVYYLHNFYNFPPAAPLTPSLVRGIVSDMDWPSTLLIIAIILILVLLGVEAWLLWGILETLSTLIPSPKATSATLTLVANPPAEVSNGK
jgi:hypothetical protein